MGRNIGGSLKLSMMHVSDDVDNSTYDICDDLVGRSH